MKTYSNIITLFVALVPALVASFAPNSKPFITPSALSEGSTPPAPKPIGVVVHAEIQPDRMEEFLDLIEKDAVGSRAEPGCIRFDVHQSRDDPNKFVFYEVYEDLDAITYHKKQPHFALWTDFKASGGVVESVSHVLDGIFMSE